MTTGQTVLIVKDPTKGTIPGNYRPTTCLSVTWKLMASVIANEICEHIEHQEIIGNR